MSWRKYTVKDYEPSSSEVSVLFADLTNFGDATIPTFDSVPFVGLIGYSGAKGQISAITTTGFTLKRTSLSEVGVTVKNSFRIYGES